MAGPLDNRHPPNSGNSNLPPNSKSNEVFVENLFETESVVEDEISL